MKKDIWIIILSALAIGGFIWAINEKTLRKISEEKGKRFEKDYLAILSLYLDTQDDLPSEIKHQIIQLREKYTGIQDNVSIELKTIISLIENGNEEIAIEKLTKIIENLLKDKYVEEGYANSKKDCPKLYTLLQKAYQFKWISKAKLNVSCFLKDIRNTEAHELAVKFPKNWKYISFLAGIEILYNLKGISRKSTPILKTI